MKKEEQEEEEQQLLLQSISVCYHYLTFLHK